MSDPTESRLGGIGRWLLRDLPYAAMLVLAVGGIALTSFRGPATYLYWMALAPIYALIVIASGFTTNPSAMMRSPRAGASSRRALSACAWW